MQGRGQPVADVFWPPCSERPGRAWLRGVRELEPFLLTLRPHSLSGQPSPLPEPLPSSPGEERRLQRACPALGTPEPRPPAWASRAGDASSTLTAAPRPPGPAEAGRTSGPGHNCAWGQGAGGLCDHTRAAAASSEPLWRPRGWEGPIPGTLPQLGVLPGVPAPTLGPQPPGPPWAPVSLASWKSTSLPL